MITGHLGVALGARGLHRRSPLPWLLVASLAPDLLDSALAAVGICNPYGLFSHTVPAAVLLGAVIGGAAFLVCGGGAERMAIGLMMALMVVVHLPLDFLTGNKLFWPGGELLGLRLYERPAIDFAMEAALLLAGWMLLRRDPRAPAISTSRIALAMALAVQGAADLSHRGGFKMTACATAEVAPTAH